MELSYQTICPECDARSFGYWHDGVYVYALCQYCKMLVQNRHKQHDQIAKLITSQYVNRDTALSQSEIFSQTFDVAKSPNEGGSE